MPSAELGTGEMFPASLWNNTIGAVTCSLSTCSGPALWEIMFICHFILFSPLWLVLFLNYPFNMPLISVVPHVILSQDFISWWSVSWLYLGECHVSNTRRFLPVGFVQLILRVKKSQKLDNKSSAKKAIILFGGSHIKVLESCGAGEGGSMKAHPLRQCGNEMWLFWVAAN